MKLMKIDYHTGDQWIVSLEEETLGITQHALKALRNTVAQWWNKELVVFQVPANRGENDTCNCYGFVILNFTEKQVTIIGDGFRADGGGEGGAGHRAAQALLAIWGIKPIELLPEDALDFVDPDTGPTSYGGWEKYYQAILPMIQEGEMLKTVKPLDQKPQYPEWVYK